MLKIHIIWLPGPLTGISIFLYDNRAFFFQVMFLDAFLLHSSPMKKNFLGICFILMARIFCPYVSICPSSSFQKYVLGCLIRVCVCACVHT